jgi:hypothetical protein
MNPSNAANERLAQAVAMSEVELADLVLRASDAYLAAYRVADVQGLTADRLEAISELGAGYAVDLACAGAQVPDDVERAVLQMCVSFVLLGTLASNTNAAETLRSLSSPAEIGQLSTDARAWLAARASA